MKNGTVEGFCGAPPTDIFAVKRRLRAFRAMCRCVQRLHNLRAAHRDLKPGNFLVGGGGVIKLGDFGTTKLLVHGEPDLVPAYTAPVGDLRYSAPEMLGGVAFDRDAAQRADIYSLGAILFEMLTGHRLFTYTLGQRVREFAVSMHQVGEIHRRKVFLGFVEANPRPLPRLRTINPGIPRIVHHELDNLMAAMGAFDFRQRLGQASQAHRLAEICEMRLTLEERRQARQPGPRRVQAQGDTHA
jgi:serine/threonine protein kinase